MGLSLSLPQLAQLEAASRLLLNPLAAPDPKLWLQDAGRAVRDLMGGDRVVLLSPTEAGRYYSEDAPEVAGGVLDFIESATADGIVYSDPVVRTWYEVRMQRGQEVLSWDMSRHLVEAHGHKMLESPIVAEVLKGQRYNDFAVLIKQTGTGDAMIWVLHQKYGGSTFGHDATAVMGALLPSFRAGLDAMGRLAAHRQTLEWVAEPLAAFGPDAQPLYRNAALARLLDTDPQRDRVEVELAVLARRMCRLAFPCRGTEASMPETTREVETVAGRYTLRGVLLPPDSPFGEAVLVTVARESAPAMPSVDTIRTQTGLTKREAEVALQVSEGLTNAALAERLFISEHTARHHVENVLGKLGVSSRAAVAARLMAVV